MTNPWEPIEGETPIDDLSFLKDRSITTRGPLSIAEAENIRKAVVRYLAGVPTRRSAPFTYEWMLRVHRAMLGDVWTWAGSIRTTDTNIGIPSYRIGQELGGLALDVQAWTDSGSRIEQAVSLHHRTVRIHPFVNGNGRWARLLANIWLKRHREPVIRWPEPAMGTSESSIRSAYLDAIRAADRGDLEPLIDLHRKYQGE